MRIYLTYKERVANLRRVAETIKTIEKISVTQLRDLKTQFELTEGYLKEINISLLELAYYLERSSFRLAVEKGAEGLLLVVTGNKGLVGSLYQDILAEAEDGAGDKNLITIGTKAAAVKGNKVYSSPLPDKPLGSEELSTTTEKIFELLDNQRLSKLGVVYPSFNGFSSQKAKRATIYPIDFAKLKEDLAQEIVVPKMLIGEPKPHRMLKNIARLYINTFIAKVFCEAKLSEIAARLINSQKASDKADALIKRSVHEYQKVRRSEITSQQLENFLGHINLG